VSGESAIRLEGTVIAVLKEATLFRVVLENGHCLLGHVAGRHRGEAAGVKAGDKVNLEMSPFDFSKGRILLEEKQNESSRIS
jgi:translation initiation factor IF-1